MLTALCNDQVCFGCWNGRRSRNGSGNERNRSLRECPAVQRCAGLHRNVCLSQYNSLKVRAWLKGHSTGNLPEDVLGLGAAAQENLLTSGNIESSRYLEDPDIIRAA